MQNNHQNLENIKNFLIKLNERLGDNCFISGTYIFEGDLLFKYLCDYGAASRIGQGRMLDMKPRSHNLHIFNKLFEAHKLNDHENVHLIRNNEDYKVSNVNYKSYKQYEIDLNKVAIEYPCNSKRCIGGTFTDDADTNIDDKSINIEEDMEETRKQDFTDETTNQRVENLNQIKSRLEKVGANIDENDIYCNLNKESKKCCLFYRFHVSINNQKHTYTFLKLETSPTINIRDAFDHAIHAAKHYFTKNGSIRKNTWSIRREDYAVYRILINNSKEELYLDSFKPSSIKKCIESKSKCSKDDPNNVKRFKPRLSKNTPKEYPVENLEIRINDIRLPYRDEYIKKEYTTLPLYSHYTEDCVLFKEFTSFEVYNKNVRTRNEMFIPQGFYEDLLQNVNPTIAIVEGGGVGNRLTKTNKLFLYNDRNYIVYRNKTSKQEYINFHKKYTLCTSLKKQTYRKLKQKYTFDGEKYAMYETVKDNRRFIVVNNRRKYLNN